MQNVAIAQAQELGAKMALLDVEKQFGSSDHLEEKNANGRFDQAMKVIETQTKQMSIQYHNEQSPRAEAEAQASRAPRQTERITNTTTKLADHHVLHQ